MTFPFKNLFSTAFVFARFCYFKKKEFVIIEVKDILLCHTRSAILRSCEKNV